MQLSAIMPAVAAPAIQYRICDRRMSLVSKKDIVAASFL
jgi:hypothetical protein